MVGIYSIKKISSVGILDENSILNEFQLFINKDKVAKKILIKGNNATGKSTLSNIFRSIEKRHENEKCKSIFDKIKSYDKDNTDVEITFSDGKSLKYDNDLGTWIGSPDPVVRVFNEDFIVENIDFNDFSKNKFAGTFEADSGRISREKIEFEKAKGNYEKELKQLYINIEQLNNEIKKKNNMLRNLGLRPPQEDYKTYIGQSSDRQHSLKYIDEQLKKEIDNYSQLKNPPYIPRPGKSDIDIDFFYLFFLKQYFYKYEEAEKKAIEEINAISENQRQWILKGLEYQENKKHCIFCGQKLLDYNRIKLYEKYRDSKINEVRYELKKLNDHELNLVNDMIDGLETIQEPIYNVNLKLYNINDDVEELFCEIYNLRTTIQYLQGLINNKIENDEIEPKEFVENLLDKFKFQMKKMQEIFDLLDRYEEETRKVTSRKNAISAKIKEYYKEKFYLENKDGIIATCIDSIEAIETTKLVMEHKEKLFLKHEEERKIEIVIMKRLFSHLGIYDYDIDKDFNLRWRNKTYINKKYSLSGGEISAIAFSYFIASLMVELNKDQKNNLIIWIDDPVCSIDYPKIVAMVTLVLDIPKLLKEKINDDGTIGEGSQDSQIIISTHNDLFFNFLSQSNQFQRKNNGLIFELYKSTNSTCIRKTKNIIKTIYLEKLEAIIEVAEGQSSDLDSPKILYIPNYIRYVLEQLRQWMWPDIEDMLVFLHEKLQFSMQDSSLLKKLYDIYSHVVPAVDEERVLVKEEIHKCCELVKDKISDIFSGQINYVAAARKE